MSLDDLLRELAATNQELGREIIERKRAEDGLRQQHEILQTIFDHIPIMIRFLRADGRIQLVNRAWERTLGWSLKEIQIHNLDIFAELYGWRCDDRICRGGGYAPDRHLTAPRWQWIA